MAAKSSAPSCLKSRFSPIGVGLVIAVLHALPEGRDRNGEAWRAEQRRLRRLKTPYLGTLSPIGNVCMHDSGNKMSPNLPPLCRYRADGSLEREWSADGSTGWICWSALAMPLLRRKSHPWRLYLNGRFRSAPHPSSMRTPD